MKKSSKKKKKNINIINVLSVAVLIVAIGMMFVLFVFKKDEDVVINEDFKLLNDSYNNENSKVFTNFKDFKKEFSSDILTEDDFENNNYVLVSIPDDSCTNSFLAPTDYLMNGNNILVTVKYRATCGVCATNYRAYLLKVSKDVTVATVDFEFKAINNIKCN